VRAGCTAGTGRACRSLWTDIALRTLRTRRTIGTRRADRALRTGLTVCAGQTIGAARRQQRPVFTVKRSLITGRRLKCDVSGSFVNRKIMSSVFNATLPFSRPVEAGFTCQVFEIGGIAVYC